MRLLQGWAFLFLFLISISSTQVFAAPAALVYQTFGEATLGLHPAEVKKLQEIYDEYRVINLEASGMHAFAQWFNDLRARLTTAVEGEGDYFPEYRISVLDVEIANAFVYKFRIPGQKFYRGHVFVSVGLIRKMVETLGGDLQKLSASEIGLLMKGLQGVLIHEFAHPKQDELVKWQWREANDRSNQSHGQVDEMSTDLLGLSLTRKAHLEPDSLLVGLQLLFGDKPEQGNFLGRTIGALTSTHPETKMRLNLVRGGLVHFRREEGKLKVEPLVLSPDHIQQELGVFFSATDKDDIFARLEADALKKGESVVIRVLNEMLSEVFKAMSNRSLFGNKGYNSFIDWLPVLEKTLKKYPNLSAQEEASLLKFFQRIKKDGTVAFPNDLWTTNGSGSSGRDPHSISSDRIRKAQRLMENHPLFENKALRDWLAAQLQSNFWGFTVGDEGGGFQLLPAFLPPKILEPLFREALNKMNEHTTESRALYLIEILSGISDARLSTQLEIDTLKALYEEVKASNDGAIIFAGRIANLLSDRRDQMRREFLERFIFAGNRAPVLAQEWANIFKHTLQNPKVWLQQSFCGGLVFDRSYRYKLTSCFWEAIQWAAHPEDIGKPFDKKFPQDTTEAFHFFKSTLLSPQWQAYFRSELENIGAGGVARKSSMLYSNVLNFVIGRNFPFSLKQKEEILDLILQAGGQSAYPSKGFDGQFQVELKVLQGVSEVDYFFYLKRFHKLARTIQEKTGKDILSFLEEVFETREEMFKAGFANGNRLVLTINELAKEGLLGKRTLEEALERYVYSVRETSRYNSARPLNSTKAESAYVLWKKFRDSKNPKNSIRFLKKVVESFRVGGLAKGSGSDLVENDEQTRRLNTIGVEIAPDYGRLLEQIQDGLADDLRRITGVPQNLNVSDPQYVERFKAHYDDVRDFLIAIFNPDGKFIRVEFRSLVKFQYLDGPAQKLLPLIPAADLTPTQNYELWENISSKRASRMTDTFFEEHVYPYFKKLSVEEQHKSAENILRNALLRSERIKNELLDLVLSPELTALSDKRGKLTDHQVQPLIQKIISQVPSNSRFRDDVLEKIAWKLELTEAQLHKFIEPLKSFNFKSLNPMTVNLLSALSVMMEKLTTQEKLELVEYFQAQQGSLRQALPWILRVDRDVSVALEQMGIRDFDWIDYLESFVRDAGEGDRLVMIELIVGSRGVGLWYQGPEARERLYKLAGLHGDNLKAKLFDGYLKALPSYEHSVTLSYFLATKAEGQKPGSELLKILEIFDTPGIKFAQMSSILGIFGPERSEELASAKDRALPPTRAKIYELLKKHYSSEQFAKIKSIKKLLGSGSIKYVVLVEFSDGTSEAVYIRRPHLDERIAAILDIAREWSLELRKDPELLEKYDFDYYLKSLEQQLGNEVQFKRELGLSVEMAEAYSKVSAHKGWRFKPVPASDLRPQSEYVLHFLAVENAVPFKKLSEEDKRTVGELIINTELKFMFKDGRFDADRHMGNFLFDPKTKTVFAIDMGQTYHLKKNGWTKAGDPYVIAQLLYGLSHKDHIEAGRILAKAFLSIAEETGERDLASLELFLAKGFSKVLAEDVPMKEKMFTVLAELNKQRVRIPLRYSMGIIKGLMIVLNEDYAKAVEPQFIHKRLAKFVKSEVLWGSRFKWCEGLLTRNR